MRNHHTHVQPLLIACFFVVFAASCESNVIVTTPVATLNSSEDLAIATPTDSFAHADNFGDGYISRLPIEDMDDASPDEVMRSLLTQWFDHYKTACVDTNFKLEEYTIEAISLKKDYFRPQYEIVATVVYLVKPGLPGWVAGGSEVDKDDWTRRADTFGVFRDGEDFRLRLLPGWGT